MKDVFSSSRPQLAVLIDPDHQGSETYEQLLIELQQWPADIILVGGSTSNRNNIDAVCQELKANTQAPVFLFPGNHFQLSKHADGILTLSLLSGRNPDYLIGRMVEAAPILHSYQIDYLPTGYIIIGDHMNSATSYITQTRPIPNQQINLAIQTALAGQYLGMQILYLEAGSGAQRPISIDMLTAIQEAVEIPIIIGGGIQDCNQIDAYVHANVDTIVIGTALEKNPILLQGFHQSIHATHIHE